MKKIISFLLSLSLLVSLFSLFSCHGAKVATPPPFEVPETFDTTKQYEIVFWSKNDSNLSQKNIYEKAAADFEKIYPNIHIVNRYYTNYNDIYKDAITNISTGTTPNIAISYPDHIATYNTGENIIVPLDSLINDETFGLGADGVNFDAPTKEEMVDKFLIEGQFGGAQYAMPFMRSTEACYINRDLVEKLGYEVPDVLTWDFIFEVSDKATEKNPDGTYKVNGQKTMIPFIYKSTDNMMIQMLKQMGAQYTSADAKILMFNDTTKEILLGLVPHVENRAFSTFGISSYPGNFLNAGQCIFAIDSTAGASWMGSDAPLSDISEENLVDFETVVRPIPQVNVDEPVMISQGPSVCIFNKEDPGEVLASWLFVQYLLTDEVQIAYSQTEGYVPVTKKAQQNPIYLDYLAREGEDNDTHYAIKIQAAKLMLANTENTFVTPVFNGSASARQAAGQMIEEVTKAVRRNKAVDNTFVENLFDEMTALYRLDQIELTDAYIDLGKMPTGSVVLLVALGAIWCSIIAYCTIGYVKQRRKK